MNVEYLLKRVRSGQAWLDALYKMWLEHADAWKAIRVIVPENVYEPDGPKVETTLAEVLGSLIHDERNILHGVEGALLNEQRRRKGGD